MTRMGKETPAACSGTTGSQKFLYGHEVRSREYFNKWGQYEEMGCEETWDFLAVMNMPSEM